MPTSVDPLATIARLLNTLANGAPLPAKDRRLIVGGLGCFLAMRCASLDQAFGLDRLPGQRDARAAARIQERDRWIADALQRFDKKPAELATALRYYHATAWPHRRTAAGNPHSEDTLEANLWHALQLKDVTLSVKQIRRIAGT